MSFSAEYVMAYSLSNDFLTKEIDEIFNWSPNETGDKESWDAFNFILICYIQA